MRNYGVLRILLLTSVMTAVVPLAAAVEVSLVEVASGLERPVAIVSRPGDPELYVAEQSGRIVALDIAHHGRRVVLDIGERVLCCGERGLLGLAFSASMPENLFVNYSRRPDGATVVSRFTFIDGIADPESESVILTVGQPFSNHNGGSIAFGPEGYLWIGMGDGGNGGDPFNHGQNRSTLLGSMLRIDVRQIPYTIPTDNPFVDVATARSEIWSYGFRNPWKFSFDRETGDLYIADVGQGDVEEVDVESVSDEGGGNYGWRIVEGNDCFPPLSNCDRSGLVAPAITYRHDEGCSVTGGYVYRGRSISDLTGEYVFGDFCSGSIWISDLEASSEKELLFQTDLSVSTFGEGVDGEIYVADHSSGSIFRIESTRELRRRPARRGQ